MKGHDKPDAAEPQVTIREAQQGKRMSEVKLLFWTNDIAGEKGAVGPKHAWVSGADRLERNKTHGITPGSRRPFYSLMDLSVAIENVLIERGIIQRLNRPMEKYYATR